jgi:hypothetical protein
MVDMFLPIALTERGDLSRFRQRTTFVFVFSRCPQVKPEIDKHAYWHD